MQIGGVFRGYFQKFIKVAFTIIVQLLLLRLTLVLLFKYHLIIALATVMMAYRTPGLMNEFMATAGQGYYGGRTMSSVITKGSIIKNSLVKGGK